MQEINITTAGKEERYRELLPQILSLVHDEVNSIANMANIAAALFHAFQNFSWVGFYLFDSRSGELVLGPFQGKVACTRIALGKGVCGTSFERNETIIVPDVEQFPGHIYCDLGSKSEIVIPVRHKHVLIGVLDVDSYELNSFDETDKRYLEQLVNSISSKIIGNP